MCNIIKIWGQRKLTLFGKITIIKSLLQSQLIYRLSVLPTPKMETMRNIDKILFDYLWDKKPHKIKKEVVIKPKAEGGLAMVDINKRNVALKLTWTKRIIEGKENKIYSILENYLKYDIKQILKCNISAQDCNQCWKDNAPEFRKEILKHTTFLIAKRRMLILPVFYLYKTWFHSYCTQSSKWGAPMFQYLYKFLLLGPGTK